MSSKPRGESKPERKVRETVGVARPGTAGTTTAPSMPPAIYSAEPAPKKPAPEPDDYDDDFEAYDDEEFEADEDEPPVKPAPAAQSKPVAKAVPAAKPGGSRVETAPSKGASGPRGSDMDELRLSMQTENLAAMEAAKYASKSESPDHPRGISASYMRQPKAASPEPMAGSPDARPDVASKSRRTKKFASMDIADEGFTFGPKEARLRRLRNSNVLEMRVDSFSAFNLAPTTKFDTYQRQRRGTPAVIVQIGVPYLTECRDIDVGTDPIETADKEVQFGFGDETDLLNIIACIQRRRENKRRGGADESKDDTESADKSKRKSKKDQPPSLLVEAGVAVGQVKSEAAAGPDDPSGIASNKSLSSFLQRSSLVMESLLVEMELKNLERGNTNNKARSSGQSYRSPAAELAELSPPVFSSDSGWISLGCGADSSSNGYMEYVRTRPISFIQFSSLQPNILITGHPPPEDDMAEEDLKPNSALYCMWDVTSPSVPIRLLSSPGFPTAASFSAGQSFLVLAGTLEGSLHLWDLRESNALHIDRDAADLKVFTGIRKACYTVYDHIGSSSNNSSATSTNTQHSGAIVRVESIDTSGGTGNSAVSSQFITLDEAGFIAIWLTSEDVAVAKSFADGADSGAAYRGNIGGENDAEVGLSPHGMVKLVKRRVIAPDCSIFYSNHTAGLMMTPGILPVLAVNPLDPSALLVSVGKGLVYRGSSTQNQSGHPNDHQHHSATLPQCYKRAATKQVRVNVSDPAARDHLDAWAAGDKRFLSELDSWSEASYYSPVTCIAPSCMNHQAATGANVLVGHEDGTIDMYTGKLDTPVLSWSLSAEVEVCDGSSGRGKSAGPNRAVALVRWFPSSDTSFAAVDSLGAIYVFDLTIDSTHPVEIDTSAEDRQKYRVLHQKGVSFSGRPINLGTGSAFVAMCRTKTKAAGNGRCLSDEVLRVRKVNPALVRTGLERGIQQLSAQQGEEKDATSKDSKGRGEEGAAGSVPALYLARDIVSQTKLIYSTMDNSYNTSRK